MNNLDVALKWLSTGIPVLPCKPDTKQPIIPWRQYQQGELVPSESEVKKWFAKKYNIAIVTGGKRNLTVLDFDSIPLYHKWKLQNVELATTYTVTTPRPGKHAYFFLKEPCDTKIGIQAGVDLKAARGIVLVPNSTIHGKPYRVVNDNAILTVDSYSSLLRGINVEEHKPQKRIERLYKITDYDCENTIEFILKNISMLDLAESYTELGSTDTAGRWWMGLCPAHEDTFPSFRVDATYNKCACFSQHCVLHRGGDVIDLYSAVNNVDRQTAIQSLKERIIG